MASQVKPIPDGFHTVTPYLVVPGVARLIDFLKQAFDATEVFRHTLPDGTVSHAELRIGDSRIMMGDSQGEHKPMPAMMYLYLHDVDTAYRRAIQAGATSLQEPANQFYGDRNCGVEDPSGNQWWIATHVEDVPPEELKKRAEAAKH